MKELVIQVKLEIDSLESIKRDFVGLEMTPERISELGARLRTAAHVVLVRAG
jgi:hypothetical protein